jgi:hypothetical protein
LRQSSAPAPTARQRCAAHPQHHPGAAGSPGGSPASPRIWAPLYRSLLVAPAWVGCDR